MLLITQTEKDALEARLDELILVKRPQVIERLAIARSYGDLSENSEYDAAKDEQVFIENEITNLRDQLKNSKVIDESLLAEDRVTIGKRVEFTTDLPGFESDMVIIAGSGNGDIFANKITLESPVGQAIANRKVGDVVQVHSPEGVYNLTIHTISH